MRRLLHNPFQAFFLVLLMLLAFNANLSHAADAPAKVPVTNGEIRQWYNDQLASLPAQDKVWQQQGLSVEQRARRAYALRHDARIKARQYMQDKTEVAQLQARDQEKYGHPDGPTFDYLIEQNRKKGMSGDAVYLAIIGSADRSNAEYNKKFDAQPGSAK